MLKLEKLDYVKHPIPVQEVYFTPRIEAKTQVDKQDLVKPKKTIYNLARAPEDF